MADMRSEEGTEGHCTLKNKTFLIITRVGIENNVVVTRYETDKAECPPVNRLMQKYY